MKKSLSKLAGVLDAVQPRLNPKIWDSNLKLNPEVRSQLIQLAVKLVGLKPAEIYLLGSNTGYRYTDTSDVDVNIVLPLESITKELQDKRKGVNGILVTGTTHPINFFFQEQKDTKFTWQDARFGVYDILANGWISKPTIYDARPANQRFRMEYITANMVLRKFRGLLKNWRESVQQLQEIKDLPNTRENAWKLRQQLKDVLVDRKKLWEFVQEIDQDRKFTYRWGFGTPRLNYRNIVFKVLEHSDEGKCFEYFKELKPEAV